MSEAYEAARRFYGKVCWLAATGNGSTNPVDKAERGMVNAFRFGQTIECSRDYDFHSAEHSAHAGKCAEIRGFSHIKIRYCKRMQKA